MKTHPDGMEERRSALPTTTQRISPAIQATSVTMRLIGLTSDLISILSDRRRYCRRVFKILQFDSSKDNVRIGTFACPCVIHSDRGTQNLNDMSTSLITEGFSAFQRVTTAASKEENAIVERANRVNRHLRAFVFDITRWSFGLPKIQCIINTTVHTGIGIAHAQLVFSSHADLDREILHCLMNKRLPIQQHARTLL
jgi:hypothetical protein